VWYWLPWLTLDIPMHDKFPERAAELTHLTDLIRTSLSLADAANPRLNRRSHSRAPLQWGRGFAATEGAERSDDRGDAAGASMGPWLRSHGTATTATASHRRAIASMGPWGFAATEGLVFR
jgi:hypothetical protein